MTQKSNEEVWFVTGSQHLYGAKALQQVADDSKAITDGLTASQRLPVRIVCKPVLTTPDAITTLCREANASPSCLGLVLWMHTFSPAKMWIGGLKALQKPFVHLHTQFHRDIPWKTIDMDFMNLHQSAHGDREFGYICTRLRKRRKVVVGHWQETRVQDSLALWMRVASAWNDAQGAKFARFGDNMRDVAVTEGDKVDAQIRFGYSVNGYGVGDLVDVIAGVGEGEIDSLVTSYCDAYAVVPELRKGGNKHASLRECARIELGMRQFLEDGGFKGFTTTFEDLHGLRQLPGLSVQRLMADGYGFGAEGDWKTAALLRAMKVMSKGLSGGTSFMEDYTYHLDPSGKRVLGAHMLEVCPSLADGKPALEIHPLGIGKREDPPRLVFNVAAGASVNATLLDLGHRFRLLVNDVDVVPSEPLPRLPVARATWVPKPDFETAATTWILAGGGHHTAFSQALTSEYLEDFAEMADLEFLHINGTTSVSDFKKELRWNEPYYSGRGM